MPTCLIIDSSEIICKVATAILETMDYSVTSTGDLLQAQQICTKSMPDVIIVDRYLPDADSHDVIRSLRTNDEKKQPYIFYCTTENEPIDIDQALSCGADDYILKPFDRAALEAKFSNIAIAKPSQPAKAPALN
ncbi:MAG: response regulator [Hyphomicrobiaceae bacterium]